MKWAISAPLEQALWELLLNIPSCLRKMYRKFDLWIIVPKAKIQNIKVRINRTGCISSAFPCLRPLWSDHIVLYNEGHSDCHMDPTFWQNSKSLKHWSTAMPRLHNLKNKPKGRIQSSRCGHYSNCNVCVRMRVRTYACTYTHAYFKTQTQNFPPLWCKAILKHERLYNKQIPSPVQFHYGTAALNLWQE